MAVRKLYTSGNQELEIQWSPEGIHLTITTENVMVPTEFIIEPYDIWQVIEDLQLYEECVLDKQK